MAAITWPLTVRQQTRMARLAALAAVGCICATAPAYRTAPAAVKPLGRRIK